MAWSRGCLSPVITVSAKFRASPRRWLGSSFDTATGFALMATYFCFDVGKTICAGRLGQSRRIGGVCTLSATGSPKGSCAKRGRPGDAKLSRSCRRHDPRLEPGQVEWLRRGSRGMDAERGLTRQGRLVKPCPRSNDGNAGTPQRSAGAGRSARGFRPFCQDKMGSP